jgi:hypothetical protein
MLKRAECSDETAHLVNWVLYSGEVDWTDVFAKALSEARKDRYDERDEEDQQECLLYALACELECLFDGDVYQPGWSGREAADGLADYDSPDAYKGASLVEALLRHVAYEIDYDFTATYLLQHAPALTP